MTTSPAARLRTTPHWLGAALALAILTTPVLDAQAAIGLSAVRAQAFFNEEIDGFPPEHDDSFARALAAGDFNGDGAQDLATGIPFDNGPTDLPLDNAGAVIVRWGVPGTGLATTPAPTLLSLYTAGGPTQAHAGDAYGRALAAGDFNGDGFFDLAVGAPQSYPAYNVGGAVVVLHGGIGGLLPVVGYLIHQNDPQVPDGGEEPDDFGYALAAGNFNGDFRLTDHGTFPVDDLAMSAPGEDGVGAVMVMLGSEFGLIFANSIYLGQGDVGGVGEADDKFGRSLTAGNFDGDYRCLPGFFCTPIDDLAIGTPYEDLGASNENVDAGEVTVLYGVATGFFDLARTDQLTQGAIFGSTVYDQRGDLFGNALAVGDFDGTGHADLAIGIPLRDQASIGNAGAESILYGALFADGFASGSDWYWSESVP